MDAHLVFRHHEHVAAAFPSLQICRSVLPTIRQGDQGPGFPHLLGQFQHRNQLGGIRCPIHHISRDNKPSVLDAVACKTRRCTPLAGNRRVGNGHYLASGPINDPLGDSGRGSRQGDGDTAVCPAFHLLNQSQGGIYMDSPTNPRSSDCHPERSEGSGEGRGVSPSPDASPLLLAQHDFFGPMAF